MKNEIRLTLKSLWYKLIRDGQKKEEYRDITPYYCARLCADYNPISHYCQHCAEYSCWPTPKADTVHFTLGYPRNDQTDRHLIKPIVDIRKGYGKWLWGANPSHKVFIIKLGE